VNSDTFPLLLVLWCLWLITALQFVLAVRGWLVERREGMRTSRFRFIAVSLIFIVTTALALTVSFLPERTSPPPTPVAPPAPAATPQPSVPETPQTKEIKRQLEEVRAEIAKLETQKQSAEKKIAELQKQLPATPATGNGAEPVATPTPPPPPPPRVSNQTLTLGAVIAVAVLLMFGFVALMTGGQLQSLFPEGWSPARRGADDRGDLKLEMERLTSAVWRKKYADGLAVADRMQANQLEHFDRLDYLFLRAYCSIQLLTGDNAVDDEARRRELIAGAINELESVVEETPKRGEAVYLLGLAYGMVDENAKALPMFESARALLKQNELPFDHNESVCLLRLAEISQSENRIEQAESYFGRVTDLRILADSVVESRARIGLNELRAAVNRQDMTTATAALRRLEGLKELKPEQQLQIEVVNSAFSAHLALREGDSKQALALTTAFLDKHLPPDLPKPDEEAADETLGSLIPEKDLAFPREVFRGILFTQAVALCKLEARHRMPISETQVARLSEPLLRGLQFDPRQRDLLGALGGLYYWFRKDKRQKALEWLEAAALMGIVSRIVPKILERDRLIEIERREALDWFRSASARFLRDPSLASEVRSALVEELGRFQEFEPLLIDLEQKPDLEPEEPTLEVIKERARYLSQLMADVGRRGQVEHQARLSQIRGEYVTYLESLERTTENMAALEQRVIKELGEMLSL